jgi:O-antigen/teichoic acid export membrane protein
VDRSLTEAFSALFSAKLATSVISIVSLPIIVRELGTTGYGDYAFLISSFSLYMILVSSGITEGVQKFVAEEREEDRWHEHVVGFYLRLTLGLGVVGALVVGFVSVSGLPSRLLGDPFSYYFGLLAVLVVAAQLRAFTRRTLMGLGLERYSEPLRVATKLTWVGLGLGLVAFGLGVDAFLLSNIAGATLLAVVGLWLISRRLSVSAILRGPPEGFPTRELLSFNGLNILLVLLLLSLFHVDVVMMRLLTDGGKTGQYKAALAIAEYVWFVPLSLQTLLLHSTSQLWAERQFERITDIASRVTRYVWLLVSLMAIGLFVLADEAIPLYFGSDFAGTVAPLIVLLPGTLGFALARPLYAINQGSGRLRMPIVATGAAAGINVVLNALLIPTYGMIGAAAATSVGYGSMFVFHVTCGHYLGYRPLEDLRLPALVGTIVVAAPVIYLVDAVLVNDYLSLAVVPVVGAVVYTVAAVSFGAVTVEELRSVTGALPAPVGPRLRSLLPGSDR